jgi:AmmeMemoRadiSam system protein B
MKTRQALFAGSWYPAEAAKCEMEIKQFLDEFDTPETIPGAWTGGIVPHAGWYFSGSIACNVIHALSAGIETELVFVFGMHLHERSPGYIMTEGAWETPFGDIPVDEEIAGELAARFDLRIETPDNHAQDNTIELQLPFIKYFFDSARIVPVGLPPVDASLDIGRHAVDTAERLNRSMKVIGSTDLTHYGPNYGFSPKGTGPEAHDWVRNENDRKVIDAMLKMDAPGVLEEARNNSNACCAGAAAAAIAAGRKMGAERAQEIAYATSYEKSPGESLVGYSGIVF